MFEQLDILEHFATAGPPAPEPEERKLTIEERFERFHAANPHVYGEIVRVARTTKARGEKVSINGIFEILRFEFVIDTDEARDEFRLNNNYRALYARLVMDQEPDLEGFFETRRRPSENREEA